MSARRRATAIYRKVLGPVPRPSRLTYAKDGLFTIHNADFAADARFGRAYRAAKATGSWADADLEWRVHVCVWLAARATRLQGDYVECGTNRGGTATAILEYLADDPAFGAKRFYCFDTFDGLAETHATNAELRHYEGMYDDCFEDVTRHFAAYPNVHLVRGTVPETLPSFDRERVAFLHLDLNSAEPEIAALEYFWPKLSSGAFVLLDDFAWQVSVGQRTAVLRFAAEHDLDVLWLPTGQGVLQKA